MRIYISWACMIICTILIKPVSAQTNQNFLQIIQSPIRLEQDFKLDSKRKPLEMLQFIAVKPGSQVLDILSGGGYTAQLLALTVGPSGKVLAFNTRANQNLQDRLISNPQSNILPVLGNLNDLIPDSNGPVDMITIINSYHDMVNANPNIQITNQRIYQLLKLGGILIVRDHEALEGVGKTATKTLHRIEPAAVITDFEAVGFKKVSEGDFLKNSQDAKEEHWNKLSTPAGFILKFIKM